MDIEDIVSAVNQYLETCRKDSKCDSFFVVHKTVQAHSTFKAFKEYNILITLCKQGDRPITVIRKEYKFNSSKETQEEAYKKVRKEAIDALLALMGSSDWEKIIKGEYEVNRI